MDTALQVLLSYQFILFCLALAAITYVVRLIVQYFILDNPKMPGSRTSRLWKELLLPIAPVINGAIFGWLVKTSIYPEEVHGAAGRIFFGLVAGLLSGLIYRVVWGMLKSKIPGNSSPVDSINTDFLSEKLGKITDQPDNNTNKE